MGTQEVQQGRLWSVSLVRAAGQPSQHTAGMLKRKTLLCTFTTAGQKTHFASSTAQLSSGHRRGSWRAVQLIESFSGHPGPADYPGDNLQQVSDRCLQSQPEEEKTASA